MYYAALFMAGTVLWGLILCGIQERLKTPSAPAPHSRYWVTYKLFGPGDSFVASGSAPWTVGNFEDLAKDVLLASQVSNTPGATNAVITGIFPISR
jgi:hypothetical protein